MKIYMVELGVELDKKNSQYDYYAWQVNDKERGLYDENIIAFKDRDEALSCIDKYVENGVKNTYGLLWTTDRELEDFELKVLEEDNCLDDEFLTRDTLIEYFKGGIE